MFIGTDVENQKSKKTLTFGRLRSTFKVKTATALWKIFKLNRSSSAVVSDSLAFATQQWDIPEVILSWNTTFCKIQDGGNFTTFFYIFYIHILFPTQLYKIARTTLDAGSMARLPRRLQPPSKRKKDKHYINQANNTTVSVRLWKTLHSENLELEQRSEHHLATN